ncbi:LON peptidase substrate-binding domain-containing protein [Pseudochryseolinea flava]|uniref:Lon N-terminal domain-containing protein n=1 Tax=Pseudochryseolinea flava TaxID=2059302 RepID=A0A364XY99_9BACT|nr:LON peptidase substrate-binding domain-containing protein [Pseudochryseolinea flava]RAV98399.1 hypothetical protein DQQ10_24025 [Pseudochryseolinea flava]
MAGFVNIPMFPLSILPMPGELVPLHIFEPRYKQLLHDLEVEDIRFGIYFASDLNEEKIGSLMRLESIIKRHHTGECDIIVKCEDILSLGQLFRTYQNKSYPGGDVRFHQVDGSRLPSTPLHEMFVEYMRLRKITKMEEPISIYSVAQELSLDLQDRYKFLLLSDDRKDSFLISRVRYQTDIFKQEDKSRDLYHLN